MHGGTFGRPKALCFSSFYSSSNLNEKVISVKEVRLGEMRIAQFHQGLCAFFICVVTLLEAALTSYALTIRGLSADPVSKCVCISVRKMSLSQKKIIN